MGKSGKRVPLADYMRGIVLSELVQRFGYVCWYCGVELGLREMEIDHIKPLSRGGADTIHNLAIACFNCNRGKWDSDLIEFLDWIKRIKTLSKFPAFLIGEGKLDKESKGG